MKRLLTLLIAAAALTPVACGEDRTPQTEATRVPGPTDTLVVYERTGGEEGARERLDVRPDGAARISDRDRTQGVQLTPQELDDLRAARAAVDFAKLDDSYATGQTVLDGYEVKLTADGRTVTIGHEAKVPAELAKLRDACAALIERYRPR